MYYHRLATRTAGRVEYIEGRLHKALRLLVGVPFMLGLVGYTLRPALFAWAGFPAPGWTQWLGLALAALSLIVVARLRREEQTMLDRFGDLYRAYMARTGRFWPRSL